MNYLTQSMPICEAAERLGVPRAQLERWALQGVGPKFNGHPMRPDRMEYGEAELLNWSRAKLAELAGRSECAARAIHES